jgi:hypothetical protein
MIGFEVNLHALSIAFTSIRTAYWNPVGLQNHLKVVVKENMTVCLHESVTGAIFGASYHNN